MANTKKRGNCTVPLCGKPHTAKGYCQTHYMRFRRTGSTGPMSRVPTNERYSPNGLRLCSTCRRYLDQTEFSKWNRSPDGLKGSCRECLRAKRIQEKYGLSVDDYQKFMDAQGGQCAVCKCDLEVPVVDHDHDCCPGDQTCGNCVRGLLCIVCNVRLGVLENTNWIANARTYLENA